MVRCLWVAGGMAGVVAGLVTCWLGMHKWLSCQSDGMQGKRWVEVDMLWLHSVKI
jgi:hypothetical protein